MKELLQQALNALEAAPMSYSAPETIAALREALAAPPAAPAPVMRSDAESDYALDERMDEVLPLSAAPVVPKPEYSDEEVERAIITLRGITQEIRGRGIDAVMLLEEQIKSLSAAPVVREPLTDEQIERLRENTFSVNNPFCPVDSKSMRKAVRAAERAHGIGGGNG